MKKTFKRSHEYSYTWNWEKMVIYSANNDEKVVYTIRWNEKVKNLEAKNVYNGNAWEQINGWDDAVNSYIRWKYDKEINKILLEDE